MSCVICPHFTMGRIFPTEIVPSPGAGGCRSGPHLTQYGIELANCQPPYCKTASRSSPAVKAQLTSVIDIQDGGHSCSSLELELEAVGSRSISFLVTNLVEFSSRDLKVLTVSASVTSCDKWFQFCRLQHWVTEKFLCRLSYCVARL